MRQPIEIRIDRDVDAGYVKYREIPAGQRVARCARLSEDVVVDYDVDGEIVGLELLAFDDAALRPAEDFAALHALAFPAATLREIAGAPADDGVVTVKGGTDTTSSRPG